MVSIAILLFLIMDPFGNLVVLNSLLAEIPVPRRRLVILREAGIATMILLCAAVFGGRFLDVLGLQEHSLRLAGGIVLFLIALGMLFPSRRMIEEAATEAPLIVPIAMPLIAGPSAISMVILFSEKHSLSVVASAVMLAASVSTVLLVSSSSIFSFLGRRGATALERLMGMLLIMLSVQMILDGINAYLESRV
jgi:multiple antibiotic resistance protein